MKGTTSEVDLAQWLAREIERYRNGPVMAFIRQGHSPQEAAEYFKLTLPTVQRIVRLVAHGPNSTADTPSKIKMAYQAHIRSENEQARKEQMKADLTRMAAKGATIREMSSQIKMSIRYTQDACKRFGITVQTPQKTSPRPKPKASGIRVIKPHRRGDVDSTALSYERSKISAVLNNDRTVRGPANITLPYVSILDGVEW